MVYKARYIILLLCMLILVLFTGCSQNDSDSQYYTDAKQFNNIYFETVGNLETADAMKTMEKLQTEESKKSLEILGKLLESIKDNIPKEKEHLYENFKNRYDDLVFLSESYAKFNELSREEKREMGIILVNIGMDIENWEDNNSTII